MIEKREKEWYELENKAFQMLENLRLLPKESILKFYEPILRLWIYPSFEPYIVWYFCEPNFKTIRPPNLKVIRAIWNRNDDYKRLNHPLEGLKKGFEAEPGIAVDAIELERELFEKIFADLREIEFSAFASVGTFGIDGVRYGIETLRFFSRTRVSWWSVYPKEWQNLVEWFEKTTEFLQNEFAQKDDRR